MVRDYLRRTGGSVRRRDRCRGSILTWEVSRWLGLERAIQDPEGEDGSYMGVLQLAGTAACPPPAIMRNILSRWETVPSHTGTRVTDTLRRAGCPPLLWYARCGRMERICRLLSDGLSTACFVLGEERGRELLNNTAWKVVFIDKEKNVTVTDGLTETFSLLSGEYRIVG